MVFSSIKRAILKFKDKYKKSLIIVFCIWGLWTFGLGFIGGWLLKKGVIQKFPEITVGTRLLVLAPHIDDETIAAGGLIQRVKAAGGTTKIVFLTNGDDNIFSTAAESKKLDFAPNEFISLGELRMNEGLKADTILSLDTKDLIFLGFPDRGLTPLLSKYYSTSAPFASVATKLDYSPYQNTYKQNEIYAGENVQNDLKEIITAFKPTIIVVSNQRDTHPDHSATFEYLSRALKETDAKPRVFTYLVHYPLYPPDKKLDASSFLFPPKKLFTQEGWYSFDLTDSEIAKKLDAVNKYASQNQFSKFYDLLRSFVKRNEIFEEVFTVNQLR